MHPPLFSRREKGGGCLFAGGRPWRGRLFARAMVLFPERCGGRLLPVSAKNSEYSRKIDTKRQKMRYNSGGTFARGSPRLTGEQVYMQLNEARVGQTYTVKRIDLPFEMQRRLEALGMTDEAPVSVLNRKGKGILIIKLRGTRFALGYNITKNIEVAAHE